MADGHSLGNIPATGEMTQLLSLQNRLKYHFKSASLLEEALTHPSLSKGPHVSPFQRLEFLGDRVLGLSIAQWLYTLYPSEAEGPLAIRHSSLVGRGSLRQIGGTLQLADALSSDTSGPLCGKILVDTCEALIGAIFLDGGWSKADACIRRLWAPLVSAQASPPVSPKSRLQEWAQGHGHPIPVYRLIQKTGPAHAPSFRVEVSAGSFPPFEAEGSSKQKAELAAAQGLLTHLNEHESLP